jgi:hypothetical protein
MEVIEVMHNGEKSLGPAAAIYEECNFLSRNFVDACFQHCPREANIVVDYLARKAEGPMSTVWHEDPSVSIWSPFSMELLIFIFFEINILKFQKILKKFVRCR